MIPGTQQVELRNDRYYCKQHHEFIEPMWVGVGARPHIPACEMCLVNDIGGLAELKFAVRAVTPKTKLDCHIGDCENLAQGYCLMCKKRFCTRHIDEDKVLCVDCMGLGGTELGKDEDEEDHELDILNEDHTDTSGSSWNFGRGRIQ